MSKHTKGPWKIDQELIVSVADKNGDWPIICRRVPDSQSIISHKEIQANMRLISAAPDMLVALKEAKLVLEAQNNDCCLVSVLEAIKKADGK